MGLLFETADSLKMKRDQRIVIHPSEPKRRIVEIRDGVTLKEAKRDIVDYLRRHKEAETFDIANDLRLDLRVTVKALKSLWEEGRVA